MSVWWQLYWPYLAIIALPVACAVIGWVARGWWDRAGRVLADDAAEAASTPIPYRLTAAGHCAATGPVTDKEWAQIVQTIKEDR